MLGILLRVTKATLMIQDLQSRNPLEALDLADKLTPETGARFCS